MTLFQIPRHLGHELIRHRPIDDSVVKRQAEIAHRTDRDGFVNGHNSFLDRADTQDRDLGLMNDRCAEQAAESTVLRDRERPYLHLFPRNLRDYLPPAVGGMLPPR